MEGEWSRRGLIHVCFIVSRALSIRSIGMVEKRHTNSSFTGIRCVCVWGGVYGLGLAYIGMMISLKKEVMERVGLSSKAMAC